MFGYGTVQAAACLVWMAGVTLRCSNRTPAGMKSAEETLDRAMGIMKRMIHVPINVVVAAFFTQAQLRDARGDCRGAYESGCIALTVLEKYYGNGLPGDPADRPLPSHPVALVIISALVTYSEMDNKPRRAESLSFKFQALLPHFPLRCVDCVDCVFCCCL